MSYYAIGIGGTGAKCLESLIYLSAAGLMPDKEDLYVLYVDSDRANGNGTRTSELLRNYQNCYDNHIADEDLFKTHIPPLQNDVDGNVSNYWSPTENDDQLENFLIKSRLDDNFRHIFDVLFTDKEAKTNLNKGFRGRPSIGAVVMANKVDLESAEPWKTLRGRIQSDSGSGRIPKVMIFGSIFGGTGAAGFPTIARLLKNWAKSSSENPVQIGGVLGLPYFSFDDSKLDSNELHVKSADLVLSTQASLRYYHQQKFHRIVDVTYLLGADDQREMPVPSIGSADQINPAHWIELCAALAATDFFRNDNTARKPYQLLARQSSGNLQWSDLPDSAARPKMLHLARFSFAFLHYFYPKLQDLSENKKIHRATWYVHFFDKKDVDLQRAFQGELKSVKKFCEKYLEWFANIQFSVTGRETGIKKMIDYSSFGTVSNGAVGMRGSFQDNNFTAQFDAQGFKNLTDNGSSLDKIVERMNESKAPDNFNNTAWNFINSLYRNCKNC